MFLKCLARRVSWTSATLCVLTHSQEWLVSLKQRLFSGLHNNGMWLDCMVFCNEYVTCCSKNNILNIFSIMPEPNMISTLNIRLNCLQYLTWQLNNIIFRAQIIISDVYHIPRCEVISFCKLAARPANMQCFFLMIRSKP